MPVTLQGDRHLFEAMHTIDHIVWAASSLEEGIARLEALTGVRALPGGRHPDHGTHNALTGLGPGVYFEILARDPDLPPGPFARKIADVVEPALVMWAVRTDSAAATAARIQQAGHPVERFPMSRTRPDGVVLRWEIVRLGDRPWRGIVPFFIDWLDTPHPSTTLPADMTLTHFHVETPEPDAVQALFHALDIPAAVQAGPTPRLVAQLTTPQGVVVLTGS